MSVSSRFGRAALIGVAAVALLLGGCGRKGALEAPPSSSAMAAPSPPQSASPPRADQPDRPAIEGEGQAEQPAATPARKTFFLDWLLN